MSNIKWRLILFKTLKTPKLNHRPSKITAMYAIFEPRIDTVPQLCRCLYTFNPPIDIDPTVHLIYAIVEPRGLSRCRRCLRIRHANPTAVQPANIDTVLQVAPPECEEPVSPNSGSEAEPIQLNADVTDNGWSRQQLREWLLERIQHPPYPSAKHLPPPPLDDNRSKTAQSKKSSESGGDILKELIAFAEKYDLKPKKDQRRSSRTSCDDKAQNNLPGSYLNAMRRCIDLDTGL
ncbi:hypothetical protein V8E54_013208 [Elaphomyces granulatus]|jgi:hypothetical protein